MICEVKGSVNNKSKVMENCAQGRGVFLVTPNLSLAFVPPLTLDVRLPWFEGLASVAASGSDPAIFLLAESRCSPNSGLSSSGTVGVVGVMKICSRGSHKRSRRGGKKETSRKERCTLGNGS